MLVETFSVDGAGGSGSTGVNPNPIPQGSKKSELQLNSDSRFSEMPKVVTDEVFDLMAAFQSDTYASKVSLGAGVYRTENNEPWPLRVVEIVENSLHASSNAGRHEYLQIIGDPRFLECARDLAFGLGAHDQDNTTEAQQISSKDRIASVQTVSGTGANNIGASFLAHHLCPKNVWISDPTWANHLTIWELAAPKTTRKTYPYFRASDRTFDFSGMMHTLETQALPNDVVVLHACAHNPTGLDPTQEQWKAIAALCHRKKLFPFFDSAYQGFATGDPALDSWAVRYFFNYAPAFDMGVAQSFSKNFGLYGQRTGAFHLVTASSSAEVRSDVVDNLAHLVRGAYSMAPRYGSTIVRTVLESEGLTQEWVQDLGVMSSRIKEMRIALYEELIRLRAKGTWEHIVNQIGMFSYTGLTVPQIEYLRNVLHIYMLRSGRISISGLTSKNVKYVAHAIAEAVERID